VVICFLSNEGIRSGMYLRRFSNSGGRRFLVRGKTIRKRRETPAPWYWFLEGRRGTKHLIRLAQKVLIGFDNPVPGRNRLNRHSHTVPPEKKDHRLLGRSKGSSPKGLE